VSIECVYIMLLVLSRRRATHRAQSRNGGTAHHREGGRWSVRYFESWVTRHKGVRHSEKIYRFHHEWPQLSAGHRTHDCGRRQWGSGGAGERGGVGRRVLAAALSSPNSESWSMLLNQSRYGRTRDSLPHPAHLDALHIPAPAEHTPCTAATRQRGGEGGGHAELRLTI
jgi:hypothetical protein